jgi:putative pyoverdin transport system ATP-binding/permease protein
VLSVNGHLFLSFMVKRSFPARKLLEFLDQEGEYPRTRLMIFSLLSGLTNGLLLAIINHGASSAGRALDGDFSQYQSLGLFAVCLALFIYTKKYTLDRSVLLVEEVLRKVRIRITDKIRHTELEFIEKTGYVDIYNRLSQDTIQISQSTTMIFAAIQAGIMVIFAMFYIAWLTPDGAILTMIAIALGAWVFMMRRERIIRDLDSATREELNFFESLNHTLSGFKEVKINRARSHDLFIRQSEIADRVREVKSRAMVNSVFVMMFSEVFFYILLAFILFVWPLLESPDAETIIKLTASILFIIGPLGTLFGSMPLFMKADVAVNNLRQLEAKIDNAGKGAMVGEPPENQAIRFEAIRFNNVGYDYLDEAGQSQFSVGPLNLELMKGEIVFIVGGNGSGKSTLLKLLTGLYYPNRGEIQINGDALDVDLYPDYRELFAVIFTDFHLFDRFYGVMEVDTGVVRDLLKKLGMASKTKYRDGAFTNMNLSTGQRKRLAYISALLDDKPIYIFDELAADQDPQFRQHFYEVLLPELREQGKTIVAVTHDDRYFNCADRIIRLDEGHIGSFDSGSSTT